MFEKILIANRGEIACRVIKTARALGVGTVAVYSDADRDALHVSQADEAVHIGAAQPSESYLRGDVIIAAALETGAEAIHPGYGFLSENPEFVEAVEAAGLVFIGPSAAAIRAMGLKDAAKVLMAKAGVPVVPGYHGAAQDLATLKTEADKIGYPVLIKAVAGGGGKGMRRVEDASGFADALEAAQSEARNAFGNDVVLIEKYVEKPRHIEVQVFGDGDEAVHLFERDCSLQRRHQKVVEEAPAPAMTDEMRAAMGAAAIKAAVAIGYKGAGTIEFIVDASQGLRADRFWFMEMNTRLQVEHPVTEMITGVDLVEWQLRVAAGERLPLGQDELTINGHAFEVRLYAEDVAKGFLPATGRLSHLEFGAGARADSGVQAGDEISPFYDPMIAKLIVHGPTRAIVLTRMRAALAATEVAGTVTNLGFLSALIDHKDFRAGDVDTGLIERDLEALSAETPPSVEVVAMAALRASHLLERADWATGFALWQPLRQAITLCHEGEELAIMLVVKSPSNVRIEVGEQVVEACKSAEIWRLDGQPAPNAVVDPGGIISVFSGRGFHFNPVDLLGRQGEHSGDASVVASPMPGLVKAVFISPGDVVTAGDRLAVLEAMKMEHVLCAARDGVIAEVLVEVGAQVEAGAALIRLEDAS
ncbi:MAG: acetyl/propionyl/methylcrotonyl-CoA carboxylase subunit alpha [Alphaproteobacteria bacterium]|nr:acetyl/propionyl/methylcrotonyl-CoA carboxylase subunit alpha [Alphaproteobacteria bacterium]